MSQPAQHIEPQQPAEEQPTPLQELMAESIFEMFINQLKT